VGQEGMLFGRVGFPWGVNEKVTITALRVWGMRVRHPEPRIERLEGFDAKNRDLYNAFDFNNYQTFFTFVPTFSSLWFLPK